MNKQHDPPIKPLNLISLRQSIQDKEMREQNDLLSKSNSKQLSIIDNSHQTSVQDTENFDATHSSNYITNQLQLSQANSPRVQAQLMNIQEYKSTNNFKNHFNPDHQSSRPSFTNRLHNLKSQKLINNKNTQNQNHIINTHQIQHSPSHSSLVSQFNDQSSSIQSKKQFNQNKDRYNQRIQEMTQFQVFKTPDKDFGNKFFTPRVVDNYKSIAQDIIQNKQRDFQISLFKYVIEENVGKVDQLLKKDPSLLLHQDNIGQSALHLAVKLKNKLLLKLLLFHKNSLQTQDSTINLQDSRGRTAFYLACQQENMKIIKLLIKNGADIYLMPEQQQIMSNRVYPLNFVDRDKLEKLIQKLKKIGIKIFVKPQPVIVVQQNQVN